MYSDDGRTWTTDVLSPELAEYSGFMSRGGWAVTGSPLSRRTASDSRDLLRSDGSQWNRVDLPGSEPAWPDLPIESGNVVLVPDDGGDFGFWVSIDDEPFVFREAPWDWPQDTIDPTGRATFLAAPDGGFIAVTGVHDVHPNDRNLADGDRDNATLMWAEVWTSPDGITWQNQGLPGFLADDVIGRTVFFNIRAVIETLEVSVFNSSGFNRPIGATRVGVSVSTDGVDWSPVRDPEFPIGADCWIFTTNMGYLCAGMTVEPETAFELSLSTDGVKWATIEPPEIDFESYGFVGAASHGGVGDLLFVSFGDMWIGHFEE
jgi:hypothetical protein